MFISVLFKTHKRIIYSNMREMLKVSPSQFHSSVLSVVPALCCL